MAFNGSGTYSLPAGNPVTTGTTISSTWANSTLSDMATALSNCVTRDGQSPATANIPMGGYKLTGLAQPSANGDALGWGKNASIDDLTVTGTATLSADPTTNLEAATKHYVDITTQAFPSGTAMIFVQTSAPTGWTKSTTHNDKALRVVSGAASYGGTYSFSSTFANGNTGSFTLSTSEIPSHNHGATGGGAAGVGSYFAFGTNTNLSANTNSTGGGNSHSHDLSLAVAYVDVIICTKD
jgi:hypothetical protein